MNIYDKIFPPKKIALPNGKVVDEKRTRAPLILLLLLIMTVLSLQITNFKMATLFKRGHEFFTIVNQMIPPNPAFLPRVWGPLLDTIKMSLLGSLLGAILAVPFAVLSSRNIIKNPLITGFFQFVLSLLRTLPTLVSALIATFVFGLGTMAGTIAIFLFSLSYVGKLLFEQIENVDMGAFEAMESMGLTKIQAFRYAVFPVVLPTYLSTSLYNFEGNVRYASILGYVGAGGIGLVLDERLGWRDYPSVGIVLVALIVTVFAIESLSEYLRRKLQ